MIGILLVIFSSGYGVGYEGYSNGKLYVGTYTPNMEYGWVVTENEIYLDTVLEKR